MAAPEHGDLDALEDVLAADVVHYSDGGGKACAARHLIVGRDRGSTSTGACAAGSR